MMLRHPFLRTQVKTLLRRNRDIDYRLRLESTSSSERSRKGYAIAAFLVINAAGVGYFYYSDKDSFYRRTLTDIGTQIQSFIGISQTSPETVQVKTPTKVKPDADFSEGLLKKKLDREQVSTSTSTTKTSKPSSTTSATENKPLLSTSPPSPSSNMIKSPERSTKSDTTASSEASSSSSASSAATNAKTSGPKKSDTLSADKHDEMQYVGMSAEDILALRRADLEIEFTKKSEILHNEYEAELKRQLKRQLDIHLDHLREQEEDLSRNATVAAQEQIAKVRKRFIGRLAEIVDSLDNLEATLRSREALDVDETKSREVWLLCQKLNEFLKSGGSSERASLKSEISQVINIIQSMKEPSNLAIVVLKSIPEVALQTGVLSEETLIERFQKVDTVCRRVAMIGDNGGTLTQYILSYLQSMLIRDSAIKVPQEELESRKPVDVSKLDTFELLARVRKCMAKRDLELALRYANQLRGEARKAASDWIMDMRLHLEVRQAAEVLQLVATSTSLRSVK